MQILASTRHDIAEGVLEQLMKPKEHIWNIKEVLNRELEDTSAVQHKVRSITGCFLGINI